MTDKINDGGPAFPVDVIHGANIETALGMSMRDYFAGLAMQGDIAGVYSGLPLDMTDEALDKISTLYYRVADAMLRARSVKADQT